MFFDVELPYLAQVVHQGQREVSMGSAASTLPRLPRLGLYCCRWYAVYWVSF